MKKIFLICLCLCLAFSLCGCDLMEADKSMDTVSHLRKYYFVGNSDNFYCEMHGGVRENPVVVDGEVGVMENYVEIKVLPKSGVDGEYTYHIGINEEEFDGTLSKEIAGGFFTVTLEATELADDYVLTVTLNGNSEKINMKSCVEENAITFEQAKAIAEVELKEKIAEMTKAEGATYETYVKYIQGEVGHGEYYWYVAFMTDAELCAVLVNPITSEIVAKRM